ncbi:phosphatase PAP2 family protein [Xylanibacter ruminicola]|uniref:Membrane-associated phospholipid phosphatase n=1 Tax=Xylanibacter ruminicola TaxID=839 RepID=A0A1M6TUT8_XYLRU|nr:phosphatase PAP2 family protein [Xylanibacter ruminicola]SHK60650.1 Membrane-associated phospholipid phosphatase [Xylanibacter ruminicola]
MKQVIKTLSVYGVAYFVLLSVVLVLLCMYPKPELHMMLNAHHTGFQDVFFKYYSVLAEWPLYVLMLLIPLLLKKRELILYFAMSELASGAAVQILKHAFHAARPIVLFESYPDMLLPLVQGVEMRHSNSFPSGHTSTFFVFFTCCAILLAYHYLHAARQRNARTFVAFSLGSLVLLAMAALGGYSRIYLSQHFLSDVCVGSIIGFTMPWVVFYYSREKIMKLRK